jgi:hypothetical protein
MFPGPRHDILELPPLTYRFQGMNVPLGGGGYFRLLPTWFIRRGIGPMRRQQRPSLAMLYFHPWEFDPEQVRLPLGALSRFRTYVGIRRSKQRLSGVLQGRSFVRAAEAAAAFQGRALALENFPLVQ